MEGDFQGPKGKTCGCLGTSPEVTKGLIHP